MILVAPAYLLAMQSPRPTDGTEYDWGLPLGLAPPWVPPDNPMSPAKVELGRRLFYEKRLSANQTLSCSGCHRPELAFTDGRRVSVGSTGESLVRNAMSLTNVGFNSHLTWADPEIERLEKQMLIPLLSRDPVELGLAGRERETALLLGSDPAYRDLFQKAFPEDPETVSFDNVVRALAAFQRTLISFNSPYDRFVYFGEHEALSESQRKGMRLFFSDRLNCSRCHAGSNFSGPVRRQGEKAPRARFHNTGLYDLDGRGRYPGEDTGLKERTGKRRDMGRFRAPTLRNIELTAPYMHDGSMESLSEVIDHYARGGRNIQSGAHQGDGSRSPRKSRLLMGFDLQPGEKDDLIEFLKSLTDRNFVTDPRFTNPFLRSPDDG